MTPRGMEMFSRAATTPHGTARYTPAPLVKARFLSSLSSIPCTRELYLRHGSLYAPNLFRGDVERGGDTRTRRADPS